MDFTKSLVLLLLLAVGCTLLSPTDAVGHGGVPRTPQSRVWSLCKSTTNPLLCFQTILPKALTGKFNVYKALEVQVAVTKVQIDKTAALISALLAKPGHSKSIADSLAICKDQYDMMKDAIALSTALVAKRDVSEAWYKFSGVVSESMSCNDSFDGEASPFAVEAKAVSDLTGNCNDIMKAIVDREQRRRGTAAPISVPSVGGGPCQGVIGTCG